MYFRALLIVSVLSLMSCSDACGQTGKLQQGIFYKAGTDLRLGSVKIYNKRSSAVARSNLFGMFALPSAPGDTLEFSLDGYRDTQFVVTDLSDKIIFLGAANLLPEVLIKEKSIEADLNEVKKGYREKGVFYTGSPHYYYLLLKPMTFIYENFKSEVKNARKFKRYANSELAWYEIAARFNDHSIKSVVPIRDDELEDFESSYWPSLEHIRKWNDYDLAGYIIRSYREFLAAP